MASERSSPHTSVLYHEVLSALKPASQGRYIDGTIGAGGHARGLLEASSPAGELLGIDRDPGALRLAEYFLAGYGDRVHLVHGSYLDMASFAAGLNWTEVDGILLDLGVSSMQLDQPERGFSFMQDGPLDMRFNPLQGLSAADLLNNLPEDEIADILYQFGEERRSRAIAKAILRRRPLASTGDLVAAVTSVLGPRRKGLHPATRTFQALRIAVNEELAILPQSLAAAVGMLKRGGRLAVISFHSLEDRIVKQFFRQESMDCICTPDQPACTCDHKAVIKEITRKPIVADEAEVNRNPRARSAKFRVAERL
ncbi:MAG: 16S rRNA (cytosine(1402)-N(4))-methyltransferase RsmH [Anaerolineales bacterium]|nr:16S rRNA (cytosine(1402)-N(4))-methyltransferase RsmH [Anaerolineales bacterium]